MRTWTVTRRTPDAVLGMTHETLTVKSFDAERDAAVEVLAQLGFAMSPCCTDDQDLCPSCQEQARMDAADGRDWRTEHERMREDDLREIR